MQKIKVSFDTWIQLLGMLGVLGGLVFVGLEMQQSQTIAIAAQIQARNQANMDFALTLLSAEDRVSREVNAMGRMPDIDPETLTREQLEVRDLIMRWQRESLQNAFQQYQLGLLPEDVWEQVKGRILLRLESCFTEAPFNAVIPSFQEYVATLPFQECAIE